MAGRERAWAALVLGAPLAQRSSLTTISDVLVKSLVGQEAGDSVLRRSVSAALAVGSRRSHRGSGGNGGMGRQGMRRRAGMASDARTQSNDAVSVEDTDGVGARDVSKGAEVPFRVPVLEEERLRGGEEVDDSSYNIVVRWCEGRGERGPADIVASCNFEGPGRGRGAGTWQPSCESPVEEMSGRVHVWPSALVSVATLCLFAEGASSDNVMGMGEEN